MVVAVGGVRVIGRPIMSHEREDSVRLI